MGPIKCVALLCLSLTACDIEAGRRAARCTHEAGPLPHPIAGLFGVAGYLAVSQDPAQLAWNERVNQCQRGYAARE